MNPKSAPDTPAASPPPPAGAGRAVVAYWVGGIALALAGALAVRFLASGLAETPRAIAATAGHLAAGAGLMLIAIGVRKRVWQSGATTQAGADADNTAAASPTSAAGEK
ncbi:MAG: hypothetical protein LBM92_03235 [Opitutaceae bacterium]|jgi:hypothetical protein|nr:hypothetical protein [Opitutaceae bacterium]